MLSFSLVTYPISDSIWLAGGMFVVGAGHLLLKYGKQPENQLSIEDELFERVAWLNGPLPDYHPQMVLQCLLWGRECRTSKLCYLLILRYAGKTEFVKETVVKLYDLFRTPCHDIENKWENQPIERLLESEHTSISVCNFAFANRLFN